MGESVVVTPSVGVGETVVVTPTVVGGESNVVTPSVGEEYQFLQLLVF